MKTSIFQGACTALVTPFTGGGIDGQKFDRLVERQLQAGVEAVVVCGTTGEAATMTDREKLGLVSHAVKLIHGQCKVIAGVGSNDTGRTAALSAAAKETGADALLIVTPYYNKCTQEGLIAHYEAALNASGLPIILYNVPGRTGIDIQPETCKALALHPGIAGIKEANPDVARVSRLRAACGDGFAVWCGNDDRIVPFFAAGACGAISVLGNLCPALLKQITDACLSGDYGLASSLQAKYSSLIDALFCEPNPIPIKAAMALAGQEVGECRLPLTPIRPSHLEKLKSSMRECGLLK